MTMRLLVFAACAMCAGGCVAVGQTVDYRSVTPQLRARGPALVALSVQDQRTEVLAGKKTVAFVGFFRGGWGNLWQAATTSGRPLAEDFASTIWRALAAAGHPVTSAPTAPGQRPSEIAAACAKAGATRLLLVQLVTWKSDTYVSTALIYDVGAWVLEVPQGRVLGAGARHRPGQRGCQLLGPRLAGQGGPPRCLSREDGAAAE
jgi:hypothetical protein